MNNTTLLPEKLLLKFNVVDYVIFSVILVLSIAIGIYFGCFGNKQKTKNEYLLGGKTMQIIPVGISLIASDISGIALLAVPADIYRYGANYIWGCVALILTCIATSYIYLPVFHKLQVTSTYEYIKLRFGNNIRVLASFLYALSVVLYSSIVIYVPSLALEQSTGMSLNLIAPIVCASCIFYTTIGGLKAVVWTDILQMVSMIATIATVIILGIILNGGIYNIINVSLIGQRLDIFDLNADATLRDGICAVIVGGMAHDVAIMSVAQTPIQRYLALPSISHARKAIAIFAGGVIIIKFSSTLMGLIMYTKYANCDPLASGVITNSDQILTYYIMDVAADIPGFPGVFIAGIFSASLSTLSASLNTLAAIVYEDFILPFLPKENIDKNANTILKLTTIIMGVICTAFVFVISNMGGIFPLAKSFAAIAGGSLAGLFTLGMVFPVANAKGALYGSLTGFVFITWVIIQNQLYKQKDYYVDPIKPISINQCSYAINITNGTQSQPYNGELPLYLYRVSFWYHTFMGTCVTIIVGLAVSICTRKNYPPVDTDLLSPFVVNMLKRDKNTLNCKNAINELKHLNALHTEDRNA